MGNRWYESADSEAARKLVTSHLRLVVSIAYNFRHYGLAFMDLISEGNIGLMQAVKKFNPLKGHRLATYAMWWIKASIQDYVLKSWSLVKIGTDAAKRKLFFGLNKLKEKISDKSSDVPLASDEIDLIAKELSISKNEVIAMERRLGVRDVSLDSPVLSSGDEGSNVSLGDTVADNKDHIGNYVELEERNKKKKLMYFAISKLNDREKDILLSRRLKDPAIGLSSLASRYSISMERVRQIEKRAVEKVSKTVSDILA